MKRLHLVGLAVSIAAVAWLFHAYDFTALPGHIRQMGAAYAILALLCILASMSFRAARWQIIFGSQRPGFSHALSATMIGYMFNNILPGRVGDLIKIYFLGASAGIAKSKTLGTVVVEKVADIVVLVVLLAIAMFAYPLPGWFGYGIRTISIAAVIGVVVVLAFQLLAKVDKDPSSWLLRRLPPGVAQIVSSATNGFIEGMRGLNGTSTAISFLVLTAMIWGAEVALMWAMSTGFGLGLSPLALLFVLLVIALGTMVPSSPGYIGTYEFFGVQAMQLVGIPRELSLAFVVTLHGTVILGTSLPGALALVMIRLRSREAPWIIESLQQRERI